MMEFTGERYVPSVTGEIYYEHVHRYAIAAPACAGKRVLDLASGEGWGAALLARHAADVVGIDIDAAAVEHARRTYYLANLRFMNAPATEIPLPDASVDVITSFETIEHLTDHDRMLDEFRRVLAPGGTLFISSPNKLVYSDLPNYQNPFHVRELYYQEFRDLLQRRFANVEIYGQRFVSSSVLHPLSGLRSDAAGWYAGDLSAIADGLPTFTAPVYFVAVCSDGALYDRVASGFVDPHDDLYGHLRHELDVLRTRGSLDQALPSGEQGVRSLNPTQQFALAGEVREDVAALEAAAADDAIEAAVAAVQHVMDETLAAERARADEAAALLLAESDALAAERARAGEAEELAQERAEALVAANAEREAAVAAEHALRAGLEAEIAALRERVAEAGQLAARFAAADTAAREAETTLTQLRAEVAAATSARDALARRLEGEAERGHALEGSVSELRREIAERDAVVAARDLRLQELKRALSDRSAELGRRDTLIAERDAAVAEYDAMVRLRDATLTERDARIEELEETVAAQAARIAGLRTMVAERDAMEARIVELQGRLVQEHAATLAFRDRAEKDGALLRSILSSRSWKMTGLVRRAVGFVRGRRPA
jgi:uncharacterized coiled-coil protein SlyX/16S rRNA G966 N2-methylase RsmD